MTSTSALPPAPSPGLDAFTQRTVSVAHRLLSGDGSAHLINFEQGNAFDPVAQGFSADGYFMVAVPPTAPGIWQATDCTMRLVIEKHSYGVQAHAIAYSLNCLGHVTWLEADEARMYCEADFLPSRLCEVVTAGGRLAAIHLGKLLIHDAFGVNAIQASDLEHMHARALAEAADGCDLFTTGWGELAASDVLARCGEADRAALVSHVASGRVPGGVYACSTCAAGRECALSMCLDVDRTGMTLMHIQGSEAGVAFLPFAQPVSKSQQFDEELSKLLAHVGCEA